MGRKTWPPRSVDLVPLVRALARLIEEDDYRKACEEHGNRVAVAGENMKYDKRFALIDRDGDERYAAIIDGTFQIGKDRKSTPARLEHFAKAILVDGEDGRFVCPDGRKPGILKFSGRAREAVAYCLDPAVAANLGIPAHGKRGT